MAVNAFISENVDSFYQDHDELETAFRFLCHECSSDHNCAVSLDFFLISSKT